MLSLFPPDAFASISDVLTYGAAKYDAENWHLVDDTRRYFDAMLRHINARMLGEKDDPESGLPHLAHAGCCLVFLLALELRGKKIVTWKLPEKYED